MKYAFPHDELKPISKTYTDSLGEPMHFQLHVDFEKRLHQAEV